MSEINLPSNSHKTKLEEPQQEKKVVERVVHGQVTTRKKSFFKKAGNAMLADDAQNIKSYLVSDVFIPALKDMIVDLFENGIRMCMYGTTSGKRKRYNDGKSYYVNYGGYYSSSNRKKEDQRDREESRSRDFDDFIFEEKGEAELVLDQMLELIDQYGQVTVNDFYDMIGKTGNFTDDRWGWKNLSTASTKRVSGGYIIALPRVQSL